MVERTGNKPPSKEPPKKPEKAASAKSAKDAAIDEAKKTIRDVTSKDEAVRMEAIQKLRNPPLESLDAAKATLRAAPIGEVSWLITSADDIQYSPELAVFAKRLAEAGELKDDPRWLLAKTVELAYSVRADATPEARREINAAVVKVGSRLQEMMRDQAFEGVANTTFDEALYGSPMRGAISAPENVFKEDKPEEETVTDPELIRLLREINNKLYTDPEYFDDPKNLKYDVARLQQLADKCGVSRMQVKEAVDRLITVRNKFTRQPEANTDSRGREYIEYDEIKKWILKEDQVTDRDVFSFNHLTHDEIAKLRRGEEGANEFFYEFITDIYSMGRTPERPELPQMYKFDEYIDFMKWSHPKNTNYYTQLHDYVWKEMPKHNQIIKNLLYTPGDIKEKLKNLQFLTPADLDHYTKNFKYSHYALSLYDEAVFDLLSERKVKYLNALDTLKQGADWTKTFNEYNDLAAKRKIDRLSVVDETRFQQLQDTIDTVGYGVNLWDSDVQNYTELDLQISVLNQELDALKIKEASKGLNSDEGERKTLLESEIKYKHRTLQRIQTDEDYESEKLRQGQHNNKGLSKLDIDVKERLRLLLKDRYPEKEPSEWELNMAVWAARQWEIGSSHIVSISAGMSTRPAYEFKHFAEKAGIDVGKYVMKAPAFEDIQRVLNPEFFQDRFSMGDKIGETFHALTDRSLLERKKYVFRNDPKYRRDDEKDMDKTQRETREFIRQVQDDTGIPYSEMITQGIFQAGGVFDKTGWRLQIATLEEMRKKYLDMQKNNLLPENAQLDNQGLGIQFLSGKDTVGKKEILERMVKRDPSKLYFFLNREFDNILSNHGFFSDADKHKFRQALSAAQIKTWDTKQPGDNRHLVFQDVDLTEKTHFDALLRPILKSHGFSKDQASGLLTVLGEAKKKFDEKALGFAKHDWPFTLSINDVDWSDAAMFQTGNIANDRRGRDMYGMSQAMQIWNQMSSDPELLCNKDPKETLKKLKEFRTWVNSYTTGGAAENATYELAHAWLKFNKHRNRWIQGIPFAEQTIKVFSELDTRNSLIKKFVDLKIEIKGQKHYLFQEELRKKFEKSVFQRTLEKMPHKAGELISYATRFTGPRGNAFDAKDLDKVLDEMLMMGIFNSDEALYHDLRNEMKCGLGYQILGLAWKYWWIAPVAAAIIGAKEGLEEEKKR